MRHLKGSFVAAAREVNPVTVDWTLHIAAVCANVSTETNTADYVGDILSSTSDPGTTDSSAVKSSTLNCDQNTRAIGGGARVRDVNGNVPGPVGVAITESRPGSTGEAPTQWTAEAREITPTDKFWALDTTVVCVDTGAGPPQ